MQLNQYYTKHTHGDVLIQNLSISSPQTALDLGFGAGDLLHAARRRWEDVSLIGIDIDKNNILKANSEKLIKALELNGFELALPEIISEEFGDIDLLISNPPYFSCDLNFNNRKILQSIGMLDCISGKLSKIPAELVFLAQNLRLLNNTGEIGIILPAGLVSGQKWQPVREFLFSNYHVTNVIQLPENSFKKTDAQTFILTLKQKISHSPTINLSHINELGTLGIAQRNAIERADYGYYKQAKYLIASNKLSVDDFNIFRGNKSHNVLSVTEEKHIHTTDMSNTPKILKLPLHYIGSAKTAKEGDIIIARVGRRCLGRVALVTEGEAPVSDCVIVVTPKNKTIREQIWTMLSSQRCHDYLISASLGVGAKYITYKTIMDYLTNENAST